MKTRLWLTCSIILLGLYGRGNAQSYAHVDITAKYTPVSGGYRYYLTVNNTDTKNIGVWAFDVQISPATNMLSPAGWSADRNVPSYIHWAIGSGWTVWRNGILPGQSLSGFTFTSTLLPSQILYWGTASNDAADYTFRNYLYPTLMPVPEPSALLALTTGLGLLGLPILRRRRG